MIYRLLLNSINNDILDITKLWRNVNKSVLIKPPITAALPTFNNITYYMYPVCILMFFKNVYIRRFSDHSDQKIENDNHTAFSLRDKVSGRIEHSGWLLLRPEVGRDNKRPAQESYNSRQRGKKMARVATEKYVFGDNTGARWHRYLSGEKRRMAWQRKSSLLR